MHTNVHYTETNRHLADGQALMDIVDYCAVAQWDALCEYGRAVAAGLAPVQSLNASMAIIVGISGYPFHAFCRTLCLDAYRAWMADGDDAVLTDSDGFPLPQV